MLYWRETGAGSAVIFLHAFPLDSRMWSPQLAAMPPGWRGIAPDFPGFGSSPISRGVASIETYGDAVVALLDHLEIEHAAVCGLSMGGYVGLSMCSRYPDRVSGLILCDTRADADDAAARLARLDLARRVRAEGSGVLATTMIPRLISIASRVGNPALVAELEDIIGSIPPEGAAHALAAMAHRKDATPLLRDMNVDTLVLVGEHDEVTPPGGAQMLTRAMRGARLQVLPGCGHLSNMEQPDLFNSALRAYLATAHTQVQGV